MNITGLKKEEIKDKKSISSKTFCSKIDLKIANDFEIILINLNDINFLDVYIDKTETLNDCIFSISFNQCLFINMDVNHRLEHISSNHFVAHSFSYNKQCTNINVFPVSFKANIIDSSIYFYITYVFTESLNGNSSITNDYFYNKEVTPPKQNRVFSDFSYIDINKEFI